MRIREIYDGYDEEEIERTYAWGPAPKAKMWLYRHIDLILLILGFALAGMALYLAGQRLGWFR